VKKVLGVLLACVLILSLLSFGAPMVMGSSPNGGLDIVIKNGRVMDPLTGTDMIANVGIKNGRIVGIAPAGQSFGQAKVVIDATGLVVAPGFIDIHSHEGILPMTMQAHVLDGVTTMIGGNCGGAPYPLADYFAELEEEGILINYASYFGHSRLRGMVGATDRYAAATSEQIEAMLPIAEQEMKSGALGVSYGIHYVPGASYEEILALAEVAAKYGGMTAAHARYGDARPLALEGLREMVQLASDSGIPHEYSHMGSMLGQGEFMDEALDILAQAQAEGVRICADIYSYLAASTGLGSAILDPGFFERQNCGPQDIEVVRAVIIGGVVILEAGSRFVDEAQFWYVRGKVRDGTIPDPGVICHIIKPDNVKLALQSPYVMCGSDGSVGYDPATGKYRGHPRVAGNFSMFLGHWVREEGVCDLMTALFKTSTQAALQLGLRNKGRIHPGADADITIFNPATVIDRATFGEGFMTPPEGIEYVIVNGELTVADGELVEDVLAGKPIRRTWTVPGYAIDLTVGEIHRTYPVPSRVK